MRSCQCGQQAMSVRQVQIAAGLASTRVQAPMAMEVGDGVRGNSLRSREALETGDAAQATPVSAPRDASGLGKAHAHGDASACDPAAGRNRV